MRVAVYHGGAVVAAMVVGSESQDEAIQEGGSDADRGARCGGSRVGGELHQTGRNVPMEVEVLGAGCCVGTLVGEGTSAPDHGQDDRERIWR